MKGYTKPSCGFTLVELVVCVAIILVIGGVVVARYRSFNSTVLLRDLAYEVALSIREAQVFGVSVRGDSGAFNSAYGMHFVRDSTTYTLFVDRDNNNHYTANSTPSETVTTYTISQGNRIAQLCANNVCGLATLDISFKRPEPEARFYTVGPGATLATLSSARVIVDAPDGSEHTVRIWATGQISVE